MEFGAGIYTIQHHSQEPSPFYGHSSPAQSLFFGMPQWINTNWKGQLYPDKCKQEDFLLEYAKRLQCVEVSSTFYAPVSQEKWRHWCQQVPESFRFVPKWPSYITHKCLLKNCKTEIELFIKSIMSVRNYIGTTLLQLPPHFSLHHKLDFFHFLTGLPDDFPMAIEFRHSSWFSDRRVYEKLEKYLTDKKISMTITDAPARQDLLHYSFTGQHNIIRYLSDSNPEHDHYRLQRWQKLLRDHKDKGGNFYFMLHQADNHDTPKLISFINKELSEQIKEMNKGPQTDLFL